MEITVIDTNTNLSVELQNHYDNIATAWHKTTQGIIETATALLSAQESLSTIEWQKLRKSLGENNVMSSSVISKLLGVASNKVFQNPEYQKSLPPSYATLYMLKDIDENQMIEKINSGEINSKIQQKQIPEILGIAKEPKIKKSADVFACIRDCQVQDEIKLSGNFKNIESSKLVNLKTLLNELKSYGIDIKEQVDWESLIEQNTSVENCL